MSLFGMWLKHNINYMNSNMTEKCCFCVLVWSKSYSNNKKYDMIYVGSSDLLVLEKQE